MNERERYLETILFGSPDRVPFSPGGPRESTRRRWCSEGLPEDRNWRDFLFEVLGIERGPAGKRGGLGVNFRMIPLFEEKVLEHKDGHYIVQDWMGNVVEISDEYDYTYIRSAKDFVTRKWHRFPVESRDGWEEMKRRYDPDAPGRVPEGFDERARKLEGRDYVVGINVSGPFWQMREWLGFEPLCMKMIDEPDLIRDMCGFWGEYVATLLTRITEKVKLDWVHVSEDMAYKEHSMVSPRMCREFLLPVWKRWGEVVRAGNCPVYDMDSDGYIGELIPIWLEAGINCCDPIEVAAGNDIVEYRRTFGRKMAYNGGIDKRAIAKGGGVIEKELMRVVPPLLEDGGFIPSCDHGVPHDISWPNFVHYSRLLAKLTGWL